MAGNGEPFGARLRSRWLASVGAAGLLAVAAACGTAGSDTLPVPATISVVPAGGSPAEPVAAGPITTTTTAPTTTTSRPGSVHYTVQDGDTFYGIATRLDTTVAELLALNSLTDPDQLFAGQDLIVPGSTSNTSAGNTSAGGTDGTGAAGSRSSTSSAGSAVTAETYPEVTGTTLPAATRDG